MTPEQGEVILAKQSAYRDAVQSFDAARKAHGPQADLDRMRALVDRAEAEYEAAIAEATPPQSGPDSSTG